MRIVNRNGCKERLLKYLIPLFPPHNLFVDMFFGSGAVSLEMVKLGKRVIANDYDEDVYNLFNVLRNKESFDEFVTLFQSVPKHEKVFHDFRHKEEDTSIWKAVRFFYLSQYSLYGQRRVFRDECQKQIPNFDDNIQKITFFCDDFRKILGKIKKDKYRDMFVYADPPYCEKEQNYKKRRDFFKDDFVALIKLLKESEINFAISEFSGGFAENCAIEHELNIIKLLDRTSVKSIESEILITNYKQDNTFDFGE